MESIDVHDLPEEEARLVAAFVEFLRRHRRRPAGQDTQETHVEQRLTEGAFAVWPLGVKGSLSREEIYDYL